MGARLMRGILIGGLVGLLGGSGSTRAYVDDALVYTPLDYLRFVPPGVGGSYLDPAFGTAIKRISNAMETPNAADTGHLLFITPEYATVSPFNMDDSLLLLLHHSYFALYDGQGGYLRDLPFEINASSEPRWSRQERDVLYFISVNTLKRYDVTSGATSVVHTFGEYGRVSGLGEEDLSEDGTHFALAADNGARAPDGCPGILQRSPDHARQQRRRRLERLRHRALPRGGAVRRGHELPAPGQPRPRAHGRHPGQ